MGMLALGRNGIMGMFADYKYVNSWKWSYVISMYDLDTVS